MGILNNLLHWLEDPFSNHPSNSSQSKTSSYSNFSQNDIKAIGDSAHSIVRVINESLQIANESQNIKTKISRINVAKNKLDLLIELSKKYPFIEITNINDVSYSIQHLEIETISAQYNDYANANELGYSFEKDGLINEAIIEYEKIVQNDTDTPFTYRRLAIIYRKLKQPKEELRVICAALDNVRKTNIKHYEWFKQRRDKMINNLK